MNRKLVGILFAAFLLRLTGVAFGWPGLVHPDEALYMPTAVRMLADRSLLPGNLYHNPHLLTYIDMFVAGAVIAFWRLVGVTTDAASTGAMVWENLNTLVVAGRLVSVACGTLTILVVYRLGQSLWNERVAVFAALLLAVSPLHVRDSHFGTNDVLMTFLFVVGAVCVVHLVREGFGRWSIAAGGLAGLATGAKYNGGILCVSVALGHLVQTGAFTGGERRPGRVLAWSLAALSAFVVAFLVSNIAAVLDFTTVAHGFMRQAALASAPWAGQDSGPVVVQDLRYLVQALGPPAVLLAVMGILLIRSRAAWIVMAAPLAYLAVMSVARLNFARFMLPVLPFACLATGVAVTRIAEGVRSRWPHTFMSRWANVVLMLAVIVPPAANALRFDWLLLQGDTRQELTRWLHTHARPGTILLADSPTLVGIDQRQLPAGVTVVWLTPDRVWKLTLEDIERAHPDLIVLSSFSILPNPTIISRVNGRWPVVFSLSPYKEGSRTTRQDDVYAPWNDLWAWRKTGPNLWVFRSGSAIN